MAHTAPAQQFGYLALTIYETDEEERFPILVKADKINALHQTIGPDEELYTTIYSNDDTFYVYESLSQILDQLESIHPHMR